MEKEFVNYELSLRMKQLGFDEPCLKAYDKNGMLYHSHKTDKLFTVLNSNLSTQCSAPLYQQAFRWFREKYGLYTEMHKKFDGIGVSIILSEYRYDHRQDKEVEYHIPKYFGNIHKSYEEAELACLEKLIEIVESKSE
jgi:hypothetical protein